MEEIVQQKLREVEEKHLLNEAIASAVRDDALEDEVKTKSNY